MRDLPHRGRAVRALLAVLSICGTLAMSACSGPDGPSQEDTSPPGPDSSGAGGDGLLLAQLRGGGAIIVIRHAATDRSEPDDAQVDLEDCSTQRNLTDEVAERRLNRLIREQAPATGDPNMVIAGHGAYPSVLQPAVPMAGSRSR